MGKSHAVTIPFSKSLSKAYVIVLITTYLQKRSVMKFGSTVLQAVQFSICGVCVCVCVCVCVEFDI